MFTVKWVIRGNEGDPVESETFGVSRSEILISSSRYRMAMMRLKYPGAPPDGFIVLDGVGKEIGRWVGPSALP